MQLLEKQMNRLQAVSLPIIKGGSLPWVLHSYFKKNV